MRLPDPLAAAVLVVVALAGLAAGCGRDGDRVASVAELRQSVVATRDRADFALERITQAQAKDELLARMDEAASTIDDAAHDLEGVHAPTRYERSLDGLVRSLRQLAFDVQATADQIRQPGFGDLLSGTRGLSFESWNAVNRALARLSREGVAVRPLARH